jgi:competence protein ComGC
MITIEDIINAIEKVTGEPAQTMQIMYIAAKHELDKDYVVSELMRLSTEHAVKEKQAAEYKNRN